MAVLNLVITIAVWVFIITIMVIIIKRRRQRTAALITAQPQVIYTTQQPQVVVAPAHGYVVPQQPQVGYVQPQSVGVPQHVQFEQQPAYVQSYAPPPIEHYTPGMQQYPPPPPQQNYPYKS